MELDRPLLSNKLAGLFLRLPIGIYLFLSGRLLLQDPEGLVLAIESFGVVSKSTAQLYGSVLPYVEILAGVLLAAGFFTSAAAILAALIFASFIYGFGIYPDATIPFNKEILWFSASLALLSTGPGPISIDSFRNRGSS